MNKQELIETLEEIRANIDRDIEIGDRTVFSRGEKNAYNNAIGLAKQLDEPEKVVIPQVVADWIKYAKRQGYGFMQSYDPIYMSYPINDGLDKWIDDNEETFAHAWLDGYEVEKEQLYYVDFINDGDVHKRLILDHENGKYNIVDWSDNLIGLVQEMFTEKEIKEIGQGHWYFAKKVDGE